MQALLPSRDVFYSTDYRDYFVVYAQCRGGIFNRVHGAMLLAGIGTPAIVIGNDSRSWMVDQLGLTRFHVSEARAAEITAMILDQSADSALAKRLRLMQERAFEEIRDLCRNTLASTQ
jgi:hypothetical protein